MLTKFKIARTSHSVFPRDSATAIVAAKSVNSVEDILAISSKAWICGFLPFSEIEKTSFTL